MRPLNQLMTLIMPTGLCTQIKQNAIATYAGRVISEN
jgi:hypothetical protein